MGRHLKCISAARTYQKYFGNASFTGVYKPHDVFESRVVCIVVVVVVVVGGVVGGV